MIIGSMHLAHHAVSSFLCHVIINCYANLQQCTCTLYYNFTSCMIVHLCCCLQSELSSLMNIHMWSHHEAIERIDHITHSGALGRRLVDALNNKAMECRLVSMDLL